MPPAALSAQLPGIRVITNPARLPATHAPAPLRHVALLVPQGTAAAASLAIAATARVAGARVVTVQGYDPRADPRAITALAAARPRQVLAVGAGFGLRACWRRGSPWPRPGCSCPAAARSSFPSACWSRCTVTPGSVARALGSRA